jgi:hypothetical protein
LKQKLYVLSHTEQVLNVKMDKLVTDQQKEKYRYEDSLTKMQEEISKMCEVMQEMGKRKRK